MIIPHLSNLFYVYTLPHLTLNKSVNEINSTSSFLQILIMLLILFEWFTSVDKTRLSLSFLH